MTTTPMRMAPMPTITGVSRCSLSMNQPTRVAIPYRPILDGEELPHVIARNIEERCAACPEGMPARDLLHRAVL